MTVTFVKPSLVKFGDDPISEHNRGPMQVTVERIETKQRMANGTMRKYVVADKRSFSLSWTELPHDSTLTVDGFWGADAITAFYDANAGPFTLTIQYATTPVERTETYDVVFNDFSKEITKRGTYDFWEVNISLEEV
jgi:hypothetical protein